MSARVSFLKRGVSEGDLGHRQARLPGELRCAPPAPRDRPSVRPEGRARERLLGEPGQGHCSFIRVLGLFATWVFSLGAVLGAMITLYGQVASRTRELGVLRAIGFRCRSTLAGFLSSSARPGVPWGPSPRWPWGSRRSARSTSRPSRGCVSASLPPPGAWRAWPPRWPSARPWGSRAGSCRRRARPGPTSLTRCVLPEKREEASRGSGRRARINNISVLGPGL